MLSVIDKPLKADMDLLEHDYSKRSAHTRLLRDRLEERSREVAIARFMIACIGETIVRFSTPMAEREAKEMEVADMEGRKRKKAP